jgi:Glutaredoxin-like domain (DUF836)
MGSVDACRFGRLQTLTLYSRPGCHLCERLQAELEPVIAGRAVLEIVDISDDQKLLERYGARIPVLVAGDTELSGYPLRASRVRAHLAES